MQMNVIHEEHEDHEEKKKLVIFVSFVDQKLRPSKYDEKSQKTCADY